MISVIIPALNEQHVLAPLLASLRDSGCVEIIVVDGGSSDFTCDIAVTMADKVLVSEAGRAVQMNAGARMATHDILLFLHADSKLPAGWPELILKVMDSEEAAGGAFDLSLGSPRTIHRVISRVASFRSRALRTPYGDQGIFVRKRAFEMLQGFRELPIMEDLDFARRLRKVGKLRFINERITTSPRKWDRHGLLRTTAAHWLVTAGYYFGIPPRDLAGYYKAIIGKPRL